MSGKRLLRLVPVLAMVLAVAVPTWAAKPKPVTKPVIDAQAVQLLQQMSEYLAGLQSFSVHVETTRDIVLQSGQTLSSDMAYDVMVQRPDHLRINMASAARNAQVFYDGKTFTVFTPTKNYYAAAPAPSTIEETLRAARQRGLSMPLADLLSATAVRQLRSKVTVGKFVGTSMVNGVATNHLAFRQKGVDWQVWIEDSQTPLPVRVVIVDTRAGGLPRSVATLSNWNTSPMFDEATFTFVPPQGAQKISFGQLRTPRCAPAGRPALRK
jgi:hypothetical protein